MKQESCQKIHKRPSLSLNKKKSSSVPLVPLFSSASTFEPSKQPQTAQSTNNSTLTAKLHTSSRKDQSDMDVDFDQPLNGAPLLKERNVLLSNGNTVPTGDRLPEESLERLQTADMDEDFVDDSNQLIKTEDTDHFIKTEHTVQSIKKEDTTINFSLESTAGSDAIKMNGSTERPKMIGEDVFTEACVKNWQGSRIKAWELRHLNPESYYYRFVTPGEGQQNGAWSSKEHKFFMARYEEWISRGWKIGASWGSFSVGIPHRVGYQCMNYYRKLVEKKTLEDPTYEIVDGKLKQTKKGNATGSDTDIPTTVLGSEWETDYVKQIEENVNRWLKQYHKWTASAPKPPKPKVTPKVKTTPSKKPDGISGLIAKQRLHKRPLTLDDDIDYMMETAEPEQVRMETIDDELEWNCRLDNYRTFISEYTGKDIRHQIWMEKQEWRRGLNTTEMLQNRSTMAMQNFVKTVTAAPKPTQQQASLALFFAGVKKAKVDIPDELVLYTRIPQEFYSGVRHIMPIMPKSSNLDEADIDQRIYYREIDDMMDCVDLLKNELGAGDVDEKSESKIEGLMVDPPWEFLLEDGRNDGLCKWNIKQVNDLLEKVLQYMSAGLIFIWTHKQIQGHVIKMMANLGCKYVENLVWFKKGINNLPLDAPSPYFSSTKEILLMFKRGEGFDLRHQRSADVIIEFEQPASHWIHEEYTEPKPSSVFDMIETLLPHGAYDDEIKRGRFVELWSKRSAKRRPGWFAFHQRKDVNANLLQDMSLEDPHHQLDVVPAEDIAY